MAESRKDLRSLAIIAHVDHGKTTLVDALLRFTGAFRANQQVAERVMDSEDLERERGITTHAKDTSIEFEGVRIHLVATPGHADFGGEVERVLSMVDAVLLVVDSVDGVMPQTRFVVGKALAHGLRPLLVVNKVDRPGHRAEAVVDEVFDLLVDLGADDEQLDFPVVYASAKEGTAVLDLAQPRVDLRPLLETMINRVQAPAVDLDGPLQFQAVTLDYDDYLGRLVIGRVARGKLVRGASVVRVDKDGGLERFRVTKMRREGYEFSVSRPEIITREIDGQRREPVEDVVIEVPDGAAGSVMEKLAQRRGRMEAMEQRGDRVRMHFIAPSRGLFGYRTEFLSDTRGEGVLHRTVRGYEPWAGELSGRGVGAIIATEAGKTTAYSLFGIQERATLFVGAGFQVYEGMIVGENSRRGNLNVNVVRAKKLTNIRAAGKDENTVLSPPRQLEIEWALEWMEDDELLEVTPQTLRLRKRVLGWSHRKR